jgi:hypothetical protein
MVSTRHGSAARGPPAEEHASEGPGMASVEERGPGMVSAEEEGTRDGDHLRRRTRSIDMNAGPSQLDACAQHAKVARLIAAEPRRHSWRRSAASWQRLGHWRGVPRGWRRDRAPRAPHRGSLPCWPLDRCRCTGSMRCVSRRRGRRRAWCTARQQCCNRGHRTQTCNQAHQAQSSAIKLQSSCNRGHRTQTNGVRGCRLVLFARRVVKVKSSPSQVTSS